MAQRFKRQHKSHKQAWSASIPGPKALLAAAVSAGLAYLAVQSAIVSATRQGAPDTALARDHRDSKALTNKADLILARQNLGDTQWMALTRAGLTTQALNPQGVRQMAHQAGLAGKDAQHFQLLQLAERLSRREAATQFGLVEWHVARDRADLALRHYDHAMRTTKAAPDILHPILANAISDPVIRRELAPILRRNPPWALGFLYFAGFKPESTPATAALLHDIGRFPDDKKYAAFERAMLAHLIAQRRYDDARLVFDRMHRAPAGLLASFSLTGSPEQQAFVPVAWEVMSQSAGVAGFLFGSADKKNPMLRVEASNAQLVQVARKISFLRPGQYRLTYQAQITTIGQNGRLEFQAHCLGNDAATKIGSSSVATANAAWTTQAMDLIIGTTCRAVDLSIFAHSGDGQSGLDALIRDIRFARPTG